MLEEYTRSLSQLKTLSREEESTLWKQYKEEDMLEARQELIEHYQPLVFREAMKYGLQEAMTLDLIQEGTVGLMEAVERFEPANGVAFSLYAVHRIRGRMLNFLEENRNEILLAEGEEEKVFLSKETPDTAFDLADQKDMHQAISQAVQRLPDQEQSVIRSVYLNEQTALETATAMDVSTTYVYRLEKRGIRRLRGMLSKLMHDRK